jgi:DNA-binding beta-propeller fold protein YncE
MRSRFAVVLSALMVIVASAAEFRVPVTDRPAARGPNGSAILPGGRVIEPMGEQFVTGPGPFGLAVSPSGRMIATANLGKDRSSVTIFEAGKTGAWTSHTIFTALPTTTDNDFHSLHFGLAFASDKQLWVSEGETGRVRLIELTYGHKKKALDLNQAGGANSFSGDLAFDADRNRLYVLDQAHFRVVIFDTKKSELISSVSVGYLPFAISIDPGGQRVYVTHVGLFRYRVLPGADAKSPASGLPFPPYGFPSAEAEAGVERTNGVGAKIRVPPVGDPNVKESNSVAVIDVAQPSEPKVLAYVRTGLPFGPKSAGGSSPSGVLATSSAIFVSNAHNDTIDVIDPDTNTIRSTIELRIPGLEQLRGILPLGMAFDAMRNWLFVAEAGLNAVGVIDLKSSRLVGHLPAGWFPIAIEMRDGQLLVVNAKGRGTGPSSIVVQPDAADFAGVFRRGSISRIPIPPATELEKPTRLVLAMNGFVAQADRPSPLPSVKHVVIIVKENRTFDEVFGDTKAANGSVAGISRLARLGIRGYADGARGRFSLQNINVTPNHHALAERFSFSDNFYADSDVSVDGHHWIVGAYPDAWVESSLLSAYADQKSFRQDDSAPGRLSFPGSNSSVHPEDQPEGGTLWTHLEKHGVSFRNFGEGFEFAGNEEESDEQPTGARLMTNIPMPDALYRNTSREYPGFNMNIPDQYRAEKFISEIETLYRLTGKPLPRLVFVHLPQDHMAAPRPEAGYPYQASYVADNDLALGKIIEYLSHSPWWREMAIFVTEDDAQGGVDHIDAHRTVFLGISPWVRRNYVSHVNASFGSILKTTFELLQLPPLNLFDASANDLRDIFTDQPDYDPYTAVVEESRLFDPAKAVMPRNPGPSIPMDRK